MVPQLSSDQEALLIHLSRPIMLAQPMAFDKGEFPCSRGNTDFCQ